MAPEDSRNFADLEESADKKDPKLHFSPKYFEGSLQRSFCTLRVREL